MKKSIALATLTLAYLGVACLSTSVHVVAAEVASYQKYPLVMNQKFYVQSNAADKKLFPKGLNAAFGSGLAYAGVTKDGAPRLLSITDRGPNLDGM